jgi:hypothetical protein
MGRLDILKRRSDRYEAGILNLANSKNQKKTDLVIPRWVLAARQQELHVATHDVVRQGPRAEEFSAQKIPSGI